MGFGGDDVEEKSAGAKPYGFVKREAGEIPALTRSGDGNERRMALCHALF
jgi:hypothetical protein